MPSNLFQRVDEMEHRTALANARAAFPIPQNDDAMLDRKDSALALTSAGFPVSPATLAARASKGRGPKYKMFMRRPMYRWGDLMAWAKHETTAPRGSSSEADGAA